MRKQFSKSTNLFCLILANHLKCSELKVCKEIKIKYANTKCILKKKHFFKMTDRKAVPNVNQDPPCFVSRCSSDLRGGGVFWFTFTVMNNIILNRGRSTWCLFLFLRSLFVTYGTAAGALVLCNGQDGAKAPAPKMQDCNPMEKHSRSVTGLQRWTS